MCQNCKASFIIEPEDFSFYEKIKVPPPTWCAECRLMRRLIWRNERSLYKRSCSLCNKSIIAMYPESVQFPVYCRGCWFSDKWDPESYAVDYDFSKSFFEQMKMLIDTVPQIALQVSNSINSDYINHSVDCINCYLTVGASNSENCLYSTRVLACKSIADCFAVKKVENSYEVSGSRDSSNLVACQDCEGSFDCLFCYDLKNCNNCFMSFNLRSKSYVWYGKQLTKEEYNKNIKKVDLGSFEVWEKLKEEYKKLKSQHITKFAQYKNIQSSSGSVLNNTKNCRKCFYVGQSENCYNMHFADNVKDTYDANNCCCTMENCYEVNAGGVNSANILFSSDAWPEVLDSSYTISCRDGVSNLFGCISLRKKSYCILNKQYSKESYFETVDKIKKQMVDIPYVDKKGRVYKYGEFFPTEFSPFSFNESAAYTYTPLSKSQALEYGFRWLDQGTKDSKYTLSNTDIPDNIEEIQDKITSEIIECRHQGKCDEQCTGSFRITSSEFTFYKSKNITLPRLCPNCRHYQRIKTMPSFKLFFRKCMNDNCENEFETPYAPDRPEKVYCEKCYQQEVY